jgi:hypothetical protein
MDEKLSDCFDIIVCTLNETRNALKNAVAHGTIPLTASALNKVFDDVIDSLISEKTKQKPALDERKSLGDLLPDRPEGDEDESSVLGGL